MFDAKLPRDLVVEMNSSASGPTKSHTAPKSTMPLPVPEGPRPLPADVR